MQDFLNSFTFFHFLWFTFSILLSYLFNKYSSEPGDIFWPILKLTHNFSYWLHGAVLKCTDLVELERRAENMKKSWGWCTYCTTIRINTIIYLISLFYSYDWLVGIILILLVNTTLHQLNRD